MALRLPPVLKDAGFVVSERAIGRAPDLALVTLRLAIKSYCSTYAAMRHRLHMFEPRRSTSPEDLLANHGMPYIEAAFETVIHFQHFAELVVKQVLSEAHPLLPVAQLGARHHVLVFNLLKTGTAPPEDVDALQWTEFGDAMERLSALIDAKKLDPATLGFFKTYESALRVTNGLRNRLLHRGRFVLWYDALDELVAGYLLPFALEVTTRLSAYGGLKWWRPPEVVCGVDPLAEIAKPPFDLRRVAFFKAMALAAFENPLGRRGLLLHEEETRIRRHAAEAAAIGDPEVKEVRRCLVCGVDSLALVVNFDSDEDESGQFTKAWWNVFMVKCGCCGFEITDELANPKKYGLSEPDYWYGKEC